MEILRFLAAVFYGGPDILTSRSNQPEVPWLPLTFYVAQGREIQDIDSTSFYNLAEIEETVERVNDLYLNWPPEWEERNSESILVVTPYLDQVGFIILSLLNVVMWQGSFRKKANSLFWVLRKFKPNRQ